MKRGSAIWFVGLAALLGLMLLGTLAEGRPLRVPDVGNLRACVSGGVLVPPSPDAGTAAAPNDQCILTGNFYPLGGLPLVITIPVTIESTTGATTTTISGANPVILIWANRTVIGGPGRGVTVTGGGVGIEVQASQDITIEDSHITNNFGDGVQLIGAGGVRGFRFLNVEISNNGGAGIAVLPPASSVSAIVISNATLRNNGGGNLIFNNFGEVSRLSLTGSSLTSGPGGIGFGANVTDVRDSEISNCTIEGHTVVGIDFANTGRTYGLTISGSTINSNIGDNIRFINGLVSDLLIESSRLENSAAGNGINFSNNGDIEAVELRTSTIERNGVHGVFVNNTGEFNDSSIVGNTFRNNANHGLFVNHVGANDFAVDGLDFSGNTFTQNGDNGLRIITGATDVAGLSFSGDQFAKNTAVGLCLGTTNQGGIADISFSNVQANENQGGVGTGCPAGVADGSGIELVATNGGINGVSFSGGTIQNNGGFGARLEALGTGDVRSVSASSTSFTQNGTRAPVGRGSGLFAGGRTVQGLSLNSVQATSNNDHGLQAAASNDIQGVEVQGGEYSGNDRNVDSVGDGINLSAAGNVYDVSISGGKASQNSSGIAVSIQDRVGRGITIQNNSEINDNRTNGISITSVRDLSDLMITGNTLIGNSFGIRLAVSASGSNIRMQNNTVKGRSGTGILLDSDNVSITGCDIRHNDIGIDVRRATNNHINGNNIVNNSRYGVSATLAGGVVDAKSNWWGEPSGPGGVGPGIGDAVTVNVDFAPWLAAPAVVTGANFQITSFSITPPAPDVGATVTISATVQNNGTDEGTQDVTVRIKLGAAVLKEERRTTPLNPAGSTVITVSYAFTAAGTYTVEVTTNNDSRSQTVTVGGGPPPSGGTIEGAVAALVPGDPSGAANPDLVIGDQEILQAISFWINGEPVPGTAGKTINDAKMLELISLWIGGTPVAASAAGLTATGIERKAALTVNKIAFTGSRFIVQGSGIESMAVQVWDLAGRPVFANTALGNALDFKMNGPGGAWLANGVYLYTVTVRGFDGSLVRSAVRKLVVLR